MTRYNWVCPYCDHNQALSDWEISSFSGDVSPIPAEGPRKIRGRFIVCTNPQCQKFTLFAELLKGVPNPASRLQFKYEKILKRWRLIPKSNAKVFPGYIPKPIIEDY